MRDAFGRVAALGSALAARRHLILDHLALRHQLDVLARSDRRFRPPTAVLVVFANAIIDVDRF